MAFWFQGIAGYRDPTGMKTSLLLTIASMAQVELRSLRDADIMRELIEAGEADEDLYLDIIDAALSTGKGHARVITKILEEGRSIWTVDPSGPGLIERVDPAAAEAYVRATEPKDVATEELEEAWVKVYGRESDASDGWDHAIKAVEALLIPLVVPAQSKPTLGHVIGMLDSQADRFSLDLADGDGIPTLASMLRLLWPNPDRHASPGQRRKPEDHEARAVVHLAVTIVQWARDGLIRIR